MQRINRSVVCLATIIFLILTAGVSVSLLSQQESTPSSAGTSRAVRVEDGSTVVILIAGKETVVHLIGVDSRVKSAQAASCLSDLILGKNISMEYEQAQDGDAAQAAYLFAGKDRMFVNLELVRRGCCITQTDKAFKFMREFMKAESEAVTARRGLWVDSASDSSRTPSASRALTNRPTSVQDDDDDKDSPKQRSRPSQETQQKYPSKARKPKFRVGDQVVLQNGVPIFVTGAACQDFLQSKWTDHDWSLIHNDFAVGAAFWIEGEVRVVVMDNKQAESKKEPIPIVKVRVQAGAQTGRTGWVAEDWLRSID